MCHRCQPLIQYFQEAEKDPHAAYDPAIPVIEKLIAENHISLVIGDCPLSEISGHLERESHFSICHYFRCNGCQQGFFLGACIRGTPLYKLQEIPDKAELKKMLWQENQHMVDELQL